MKFFLCLKPSMCFQSLKIKMVIELECGTKDIPFIIRLNNSTNQVHNLMELVIPLN